MATVDLDEQQAMMTELFDIAQDEFLLKGISTMPDGFGIVTNDLVNVPEAMWSAWSWPTPGPTRPEQYFFER